MLLKMNAPPASSSDDSSRQLLLACIVSDPLVVAGKWADEPEAFKKMKAALGVQLAQALESSFGLDAEASEDYVDVLTDGFAIRLFLFSNRSAALCCIPDSFMLS